jgi:hypothetical protein
MSRLKFPLV